MMIIIIITVIIAILQITANIQITTMMILFLIFEHLHVGLLRAVRGVGRDFEVRGELWNNDLILNIKHNNNNEYY